VTFIDSTLNSVQKELKTPGTDKVLATLKITLHVRADFVRVENINAPEKKARKSTASENNKLIKFLMNQQAATTPNNDPALATAIQCAQNFIEKERRRTEMVRQTTLTSQSTAVDKMLHAVQTSRQWEWDKGHRTAAPQPTGLNVSMRNYQLESLQFMLECETAELGVHEATYSKIITLKDKKTIYYSTTLGTFAHAINGSIKGGMLAEEMGLGKTIESLACILAHPRPSTEVCKEQMELVRADKTVNAAHRERIERGALEFGGTLVVCKVCKKEQCYRCC
jgi:SNF2 family DNA or RNA helicase